MAEEFLIEEFKQQHQNVREIMSLTFQKVQFFLNLETFVLGAILTIFSLGIKDVIYYLFLPTCFLSIFGHTIFITTVHAIVQEISLDFVNNLIRIYFRKTYKDDAASKYIYFAKAFETRYLPSFSANHLGESRAIPKSKRWKDNKDPSTFIALFVGNINSFNITITILGFLLFVLRLLQISVSFYALFLTGIPALFIVREIYLSIFFAQRLDKEQDKTLEEWRSYLREENLLPKQ